MPTTFRLDSLRNPDVPRISVSVLSYPLDLAKEASHRREPQHFMLTDLNAKFILGFLDYLETERKNPSRSRNARLAAVRSFLKYAAHHDLSALDCIQHALAVPMKRFDRPLPEFLSREEIQAILDPPDTRTWCGQRDRVLLTTLYNTGARVSEVLGLTAKDLILEETPAVSPINCAVASRKFARTARLLLDWSRFGILATCCEVVTSLIRVVESARSSTSPGTSTVRPTGSARSTSGSIRRRYSLALCA
jgi:integrase